MPHRANKFIVRKDLRVSAYLQQCFRYVHGDGYLAYPRMSWKKCSPRRIKPAGTLLSAREL